MFGMFIAMSAAAAILALMCVLGAAAWVLEKIIERWERR